MLPLPVTAVRAPHPAPLGAGPAHASGDDSVPPPAPLLPDELDVTPDDEPLLVVGPPVVDVVPVGSVDDVVVVGPVVDADGAGGAAGSAAGGGGGGGSGLGGGGGGGAAFLAGAEPPRWGGCP